jgi:hypothetical protein
MFKLYLVQNVLLFLLDAELRMKFFFSVRNVAPFALLPALSVTSALKPKKWKKKFSELSIPPNRTNGVFMFRPERQKVNAIFLRCQWKKERGMEKKEKNRFSWSLYNIMRRPKSETHSN